MQHFPSPIIPNVYYKRDSKYEFRKRRGIFGDRSICASQNIYICTHNIFQIFVQRDSTRDSRVSITSNRSDISLPYIAARRCWQRFPGDSISLLSHDPAFVDVKRGTLSSWGHLRDTPRPFEPLLFDSTPLNGDGMEGSAKKIVP